MPDQEVQASKGEPPVQPLVFNPAVFRKNLKLSGSLTLLFLVTYFTAAVITSAPLKGVAATTLLGLPLAAWVGWIAICMGIVVTRVYLVRTR